MTAQKTINIFPLHRKAEGKKIGIKSYIDGELRQSLAFCGVLKFSKTYRTGYLPYDKEVCSRFAVYPTAQSGAKNSKRAAKPTH